MTTNTLLAASGHINDLTLAITGDPDFDTTIIGMRIDGTLANNDEATEIRLHTDGYKASLQTTWASDQTGASNSKWFNCVMVDGGSGGYCIYAKVDTAGEEEALTLHWVGKDYIGVSDTPADSSDFTSGTTLANF